MLNTGKYPKSPVGRDTPDGTPEGLGPVRRDFSEPMQCNLLRHFVTMVPPKGHSLHEDTKKCLR